LKPRSRPLPGGARCGIVPPFILEAIARNGTPAQRRAALAALSQSGRLRGRREAFSVFAMPLPAGEKRRIVYDAGHATKLPGRLVRGEGDAPTGDAAADEAYDGAGETYDFYLEEYGRNSVDDRGVALVSTVHYGEKYDNAFWDGTQMVYGDGDGELFERFTRSIDVIAHELTHGVTEKEARLEYHDQAGALNESMSDVFGSLVKQRLLGQTAEEADWIIGEGLFTPAVRGVGLRSLRSPGTAYADPVLGNDPQPSHMSSYDPTADDNGGVHINSGIPNHAFYLAAVAIKGRSWEKAGRIWYVALSERLRATSQFADAARATVTVAGELFGAGGAEAQAVSEAWRAVGVLA
jgi:Zn-dependent metalloprotease